MATISGYDSNSISVLFSNFSSNTNNASGSYGINLSDYNSIRNGSYGKLVKSFYAKEDGSKNPIKTTTSTSGDSTKTIANMKSTTESLTNSAKKLYDTSSNSVFKKKSITGEDGSTTMEYDKDAIYSAIKSFVSDYNSVVEATAKSNTDNITNAAANMINNTNANSKMLSSIGISIDSKDYTLSINEDTFKKANMENVKSIFNGNGSFGYATAVKASMIHNYADLEGSKSNTYGGNGSYSYNYSSGDIYNSFT